MKAPPRAAEVGLSALLWIVFIVGISVLTLTVPVFTSALSQSLDVPDTAGLRVEDVVRLSGIVRAFVADLEYEPLPAVWRGQPAFDASAVSHLADVRSVLSGARVATGIAALLLAIYLAACIAHRRFDILSRGMLLGAGVTAGALLLAALAAVLDFERFFTLFHGLFFADGTWTFPADSLLIRLFPERFWAAAGASWAVLALVLGAVLAAAAMVLRLRAVHKDASRMDANV
ncbi:MAG: DUF1461 domain-containing protein [Coriobacteriia bacterium]|nr:DUF1461 domain-containing protein [Coriobacteriia bacterium]